MWTWLKNLVGEEQFTSEDFAIAVAWTEASSGQKFFLPEECPFALQVRLHGVNVWLPQPGVRHDN